MNCRERALRAIQFESPDKIPLSYSVIPPELFKYGQRFIDLCKQLIVYANILAELETLMANLAPEGLCLGIYSPFTDLEQTAILKALERRYGALAFE